jgi:serine/threonine-protein kinase
MDSFSEHLQAALGPNYQLERELVGGGMSRVFVAEDRHLGRRVVVKVLPPELAAGVNRERFRREIQVAAQLQHPHIVPLLSAGERDDLLWYTMPFIEGESLRAALERKRTFPVRDVVRILHDVVDALAVAHARGVVHRDIKPANVLMQGSHALVTDFGVAKAINAAMPITTATAAGIAIGTPAYMAPEQLAGDPAADHRMDIYAAGLVAYELLTGESPFAGPSPRETLAAQLTRDPKPLHELSPSVPRSFSTLVMRCLAKDPAERPATADEILRELDSLTVPIAFTPQNGGTPARKPPRRNHTLIVTAGVVALGAVAIAALIARDRRAAATTGVVAAGGTASTAASATASNASATTTIPAPPKIDSVPPPPPGTPALKTDRVLTHAESVAIAEAVQKRIAAARARDSAAKARIAEQTQRRMLDSIITANSGATGATSGPRRIIVAEPRENRNWPEIPLLGRAVADSLRRMLRVRSRQYSLVNPDSVRDVVANQRNADSVGAALSAELLASIQLVPTRGDSAYLLIQLYDLGADRRYRTRTVGGRPVLKSEVLANLDAFLLQSLALLEDLTRSPRKP